MGSSKAPELHSYCFNFSDFVKRKNTAKNRFYALNPGLRKDVVAKVERHVPTVVTKNQKDSTHTDNARACKMKVDMDCKVTDTRVSKGGKYRKSKPTHGSKDPRAMKVRMMAKRRVRERQQLEPFALSEYKSESESSGFIVKEAK